MGKKPETGTKPTFPSPVKRCNFTPDFSNLTIIQTNSHAGPKNQNSTVILL